MPKEALKITEATFDLYVKQLGPAKRYGLEDVKNNYLVRDTVEPTRWSWMSKRNFDRFYVFTEPENPIGFAAVIDKES